MTNDFDIGRGAASGRTGDAGARVFVLGAKDVNLAHVAGPGVDEYSEVKQVVDLTDFDLVMADLRTTGRSAGTYQGPAGWRTLAANELFRFNFDLALDIAPNLVVGGFDFVRQGEMNYGVETYSPDATRCRTIPAGATLAELSGIVPVELYPAPHIHTYTFEWWMKFDADAHVTSTGISPEVFKYFNSTSKNGIRVQLIGTAGVGAHSWMVQIEHRVGGVATTMKIVPYTITTSIPWQLFQVVFDKNLASPNKIKLYIDGVYIGNAAGAFPEPNSVGNNQAIHYGSPLLTGEIDACRMLNIALSPAQCLTSYNECIAVPASISHEWRMQILVDDVILAERVIPETEDDRALSDFAAPVRQFRGPHEVAFRLVWATV